MFKKVLVANRGEIAIRIFRTCRELGIETAAVYSEADATAAHVRYADAAYCVGPAASTESYLQAGRIIEAAKSFGAEAIHPGFGFLSERADFSAACKAADIVFVGPSARAIRTMGNKTAARAEMLAAGVPVVPGTKGNVEDVATAEKEAADIGFPIMQSCRRWRRKRHASSQETGRVEGRL